MTENQLTTPDEIWKGIPGFPAYDVSDWGRVRSYCPQCGKIMKPTPQRILRPCPARGNYLRVTLREDGKNYHFMIHQLVLLAFKGPCPLGMEGCHEDGVRTKNHLSNLRYDTPNNNFLDRYKHSTDPTGERNPSAKLTDNQVRGIRQLYAQGNYSQTKLAEMFNIKQQTISLIVNRKKWKHLP